MLKQDDVTPGPEPSLYTADAEAVLPRRTLLLEAAIVGAAVAVIYLLTMAGSHNEGEDGVGYLLPIRSGSIAGIFNPYHLIYNWLGWTAYNIARLLGFGGGPMGPMQVLDTLLGATGVATLWVLLRVVTRSRGIAAAGCGILAFAYGYWGYSVDVEVYVLSTLLLIISLAAAWHAAMHPSPRAFALLGVANGFAVLGHNTNALFGFVALTAVAIASRTQPPRAVGRYVLSYAAGGVAVVVPLYALAIPVVGLHSPREFYDWLTAYAQSGDWGYWSAQSGPKAVVGVTRALIGGHFALSLGRIRTFMDSHFHDKSLREEFFLVRNYSHVLAGALLILAAGAAAGIAFSAGQWLRRQRLTPAAGALAVLCVAWLVPYAIFFAWWEPANLEFWIAVWVPIAILTVLPLTAPATRGGDRWRRAAPIALGAGIACLFVVNLLGSVGPQRTERDDYWRVRTDWYEQNTRPSDLVFANGYIFTEYLRYFGKGAVIDVNNEITGELGPAKVLGDINRRIAANPGSRVLFSSELLSPGDDAYSHCIEPSCSVGAMLREALLPRLKVIADGPLEKVWELQR